MNEINIKLTMDGQEVIQTLRLTDAEYNKLYTKFNSFQGFPPQAFASMKALQAELLRTYEATEETVGATMDFIKYYGISETQIQQLIRSLRDEQRTLSVTSAEYKTHSAAITNLNMAYDNIVTKQNQFPVSSGKVQQGTSSMNMALGQFGFMLGDASMFMTSFRMGLMSIGNNIPMIIQYFQYASKEAKDMSQTIGQSLVNSLKGPGGLLLAVNAVMLIMQLLPAIFRDTTKEVKKQADEIKKLKDEYSNLTKAQIDNYLVELDKQISDLEKKHPNKGLYGQTSTIIGGLGPAAPPDVKPYDIYDNAKDRFGSDYEDYQSKLNRKKALQEARTDMGELQELDNQVKEHQKQLEKLSKNPDAEYYWKKIVPNAKNFNEAQKAVREWLKISQEAVNDSKGKKGKEGDTDEEKVSKRMNYYEELTKYDKKYNDLYKAFLDDQLNYYLNTLAKEKGGLEKLSAEQLETINNIKEKLTDSRFAPRPDFSNLKPLGLDTKGLSGVPLTDKEEKQKRDALTKEKELLKLKSDLFGETYDEEKQQIDEWYNFSIDKYNEDLRKHKTTTEEKELIEKLYHKKIADLEDKTLQKKLNGYQQVVSAAGSLFSNIYQMAEQSAISEINEWKEKEDKKINEEHKAALKHAKTQNEKERIDEQYQARKDKLDQEANDKAKERLIVWFTINQAVSAAAAIISSIAAGLNTLELMSKYLPFPLPQIAMGTTIAAGLAQAAMISQQKIPGYEKGGIVVGEKGPEIIAPMDSYAQGQAELVMKTIAAVKSSMQEITMIQMSRIDPELSAEIRNLNNNFKEYAKRPLKLSEKLAKVTYLSGLSQSRESTI